MTRKRKKRKDRPVADVAAEAGEELGKDGPRVARLASSSAEQEDAFAAGVQAAGDSDRPAGVHAAPEHPTGEPRPETGVDRVFGTELEDADQPELTARPKDTIE